MTSMPPDIYVADGNITLFYGSHSERFKKDTLYSSLLAQLVANSTPNTWFASYKKTLSTLFWSLNSFGNRRIKKEPSSVLTLAKIGLSSALREEQLQQLGNAFSIIKQLPDDSPIVKAILNKIQRENVPSANPGNPVAAERTTFTISTLLTIVCKNKTTLSLHISFKSYSAVDITILDQVISQRTILDDPETFLWSTSLLEDKYETVRNQVTGKLGSTVDTHLFHINPTAPIH
ncbi:hypothetical protein [Pseudomonas sp. H3(2019)]|uniref:hypothetical protein n=1 Tax=Pseudomonas sp. H3(2019) TaxID=2598724 RepID=UPI00118EA663|nr:hypothetical protein [Pseudomonas sp. H3(2019)]TVT83835.1 hypothetical protein FPT12_11810 [Pseudomonas sp. H3(2019)]